MSIVVAALMLVIGGLLGLFGGGGSILAVPVLVHIAGMGGKEAIAMSLLVVGGTSMVGAARHAYARNIDWGAGLLFAPFAMAGSFGGGWLAKFIPEPVLLGLFAVTMIIAAIAMLRGKKQGDDPDGERAAMWLIALEGLAMGGFTGLVGAGGGFLVVPTLMMLGGLSMHRAVGTSLLVVSSKSFAGLLGYVSHVEIDWALGGMLVALATVGTILGASISERVSPDHLRKGFAYFVLLMGFGMLGAELL